MIIKHAGIGPLTLAAIASLALAACSDSSDFDFEQSIADADAAAAAAAPPQALLDPANGVIPFPNSVLFAGSEDGTLNAPIDPTAPDALQALTAALNETDGFSTTSTISTQISEPLDPASVALGDNVRVFEVTTSEAGAVSGIVGELGATDVAVVAQGNTLAVLPVQPLQPSTDYMVIVTNGLTGADDAAPLTASLTYRLLAGPTELSGAAAALEPLRLATQAMLGFAEGAGVTREDVVLSWTFKTLSTREVLQAVKDTTVASTLVLTDTGDTTADFLSFPGLTPAGNADVWIGSLDVPYYQTAVGEDGNPLPALNSSWSNANGLLTRFNPLPEATGTETIPVLLSVPNGDAAATQPAAGWPVVIFQHGITRSRLDMLLIAETFADAGLAMIAIDQPMHGIDDPDNPLHASQTVIVNDRERTFAIDVVDNTTGQPGPDGTPDATGTHYYNLANLPNTRDNVRQGVADLLVLSASIAGATGDAPLDAASKTFIGQSLGGIVGTVFLSYDDSITTGTLANPGGSVVRIIEQSAPFGPTLQATLSAAGAPPGSAEYEQFLIVAQTVVDAADPLNHARDLAAAGDAIHLIEVAGDTTIVNSVATAPLVGTTPLARTLGLGLQPSSDSAAGSAWFRFSEGNHRSFLDPTASAAATLEMQSQAVSFATSNGTNLPIANPDVIEQQ